MQRLRRIACLCGLVFLSTVLTFAQQGQTDETAKNANMFNHLDLSVNVGTTGIGFDLAMPMGNYVQVRTGFDVMPKFRRDASFNVYVGDPNDLSDASRFDRLADMLEDFTGYRVNNTIDMTGKPTFNNFKLLVDLFPFKKNKHWHFTAGFYLGSPTIAKARNTIGDMPSLMAMAIYNNMYDKIKSGEGINLDMGDYRIPMFNDPEIEDRILSYGRMGIHVGDWRKNQEPYMMVPDENNTVSAKVKVNSFRPYLGFGYSGRLLKGSDEYGLSFDCGVMMWGGTPKIITHDGTDLAQDIYNIRGKVGDYVDLIKKVKAFPIIQLKIVRRLF